MRNNKRKKISVLSVTVVLLALVFAGMTIAFLVAGTDEVENTFKPSEVTTYVDETLEGDVKKNVRIQNTGDVDAFIRTAVVVTWKNAEGEVYPVAPTLDDYEIQWSQGGWLKGADGYYYHTAPVKNGGYTPYLFTTCNLKEGVTPPEGYYLNVEIIASGVQADGESKVDGSWKAAAEQAWSSDIVTVTVTADENGNKTLSVSPLAE